MSTTSRAADLQRAVFDHAREIVADPAARLDPQTAWPGGVVAPISGVDAAGRRVGGAHTDACRFTPVGVIEHVHEALHEVLRDPLLPERRELLELLDRLSRVHAPPTSPGSFRAFEMLLVLPTGWTMVDLVLRQAADQTVSYGVAIRPSAPVRSKGPKRPFWAPK